MKRLFALLSVVTALAAALTLPANSQEAGEVDASVTPLVLAVSVTPNTVDYGTLPLSQADNTRTQAASGAITATNESSVAADLSIRGSDATSSVGDADWTLDCTGARGEVSHNTFAHRFDDSGSFSDAEGDSLCADTNKSLATGVPALTGEFFFSLQMNMPTGTDGYSERSTTVTVVATASSS